MFCTNCGTQNKAGSKFCVQCGNALTITTQRKTTEPEVDSGRRSAYRSPSSGRSGPVQPGNYARDKTPLLAVGLSFLLTGVGQFYNGDTKKGALMLGGAVLLVFIVPFLVLPIWIWSMIDAYQVAEGKKPLWN